MTCTYLVFALSRNWQDKPSTLGVDKRQGINADQVRLKLQFSEAKELVWIIADHTTKLPSALVHGQCG